jgi:DNA-binding CsgD family transcriptional regulator
VVALAIAAALVLGLLGVPWLHALLAGFSIVAFRLAIAVLPAFRPAPVIPPHEPPALAPTTPSATTVAGGAAVTTKGGHPVVRGPGGELTRKELEVALLVAEGMTNREIADRLVLKESTIDTHLEHIRDKLDIHNRAEIVTILAQHGRIPPARRQP